MQNDTQILKIIKYPRESGEYLHFGTYQREYCWGNKECHEFTHSLENACKGIKVPFGSVSSYYMKDKQNDEAIEIVDGQQRLVSFSLFMLALYYNTNDENIKENCKDCLFNINSKPLLHFDYNDENNEAYESILYHNEIILPQNQISKNYLLFEKYIKNSQYSHIDLWNGLRKLVVFEMQCESKEEALLLFTSINGYGKKVKSHEQIIPLIELHLEQLQDDCHFDNLLQIFDKIKHKILSDKNLISNFAYVVFKETIRYKDILLYLENLIQHYGFVKFIYLLQEYCRFEDNTLEYIRMISTKASLNIKGYLYKSEFIRLLGDLYGQWKIIDEDLEEKKLTEIIHFYDICCVRQKVMGVRVAGVRIQKFDNVVAKVKNYQNENNTPFVVSFKNYIKQGLCVEFPYPCDNILESALENKNWYHSQTGKRLLYEYNNYLSKGEKIIDFNSLTIEHIIPQSTKNDKIHRLGNLTLLSDNFNKQASNKCYSDKKEIYLNSQLKINDYLKEKDDFTEENIIERTKEISHKLVHEILV